MKPRLLLPLVLLLTSHARAHAATLPQKPNILLILADDLGYGDLQCYNPERGKIPTPHLDKLAAEGMRFTDGHSSSGVCTPSRYALLTGRYHWRTRLQSGIVGFMGEPLITPERTTLASLAKKQGYETACIGKWHLGWNWPVSNAQRALMAPPRPLRDEAAPTPQKASRKAAGSDPTPTPTEEQRSAWSEIFSKPIAGGPTTRGFDFYFGTDVPNWPPYCFIQNDRTLGIPTDFLSAKLLGNNQASLQGPALKDWTLEPILPALVDRTAAFIHESAQQQKPFLVYLPLTSPHTPLAVNAEWKNKSGLNAYADFVQETDAAVGRVLAALEESGTARNTLVVFTSDNGCAPYAGVKNLEQMGHFPSGPLRGYKADAWEGGHRVPFIVRWPGVVQPGASCTQLVHQADFLRTFAEIWGEALPENAGEDSFSLLPLLKGGSQPVRETAISTSIAGIPALRQGPWKYIAAPGSGGWSPGTADAAPVQLYHLENDLAEGKNLASQNPEKVAQMQQLLEKLITSGRSSSGAPQPNDVEVLRYPRETPPKKKAGSN